MALPLQSVKPGDKLAIPARDWNAMLAATRWVEAQQRSTGGGPAGGPTPNPVVVRVKNASSADVKAGGVLGIDEPIFPPSGDTVSANFILQIDLKCITPTADHRGAFVVLLEPLKSGAIGRAVISGAAVVKVDAADSDAEDFKYAEAGTVSTALKAVARGSARILWRQSGTGEKWAVVHVRGGTDYGVLVRVTGSETGGGKYTGVILDTAPVADVDDTADATSDEVGTGSIACRIVNTRELGKSTHDIDTGSTPTIFPGRVVHANSDGLPIVVIDGAQHEDCVPPP